MKVHTPEPVDVSTKIADTVSDYLTKQGYQVTKNAKILGSSGIEHPFQLLVRLNDGLTDFTCAICIIADQGPSPHLQLLFKLFDFSNAAFDCGIRNRTAISVNSLNDQVTDFAKKHNIHLVKSGTLDILPGKTPAAIPAGDGEFLYTTKDNLLNALTNRGYAFEEKGRLTARSGTEYLFDILGYAERGLMPISLGIDFFKDTIDLERVSLFETKSFDAGINQKTVIAENGVTAEAKQFADHHNIKIITSGAATTKTEEAGKPGKESASALVLKEPAAPKAARTEPLLKETPSPKTAKEPPSTKETAPPKAAREDIAVKESESDTQSPVREVKGKTAGTPEPSAEENEKEASFKKGGKTKATGPQPAMKSIRNIVPQMEALQLIPEAMARRYNAIPLSIDDSELLIAMGNNKDVFAIESFAVQSRKRIKAIAANPDEVRHAIDMNYKSYGKIEEQVSQAAFLTKQTIEETIIAKADSPLADALNLMIEQAARTRASDIHIEPEETNVRIRFRVDGLLQETMTLPLSVHRALLSRLKILAGMDIADHLRPQDGQFALDFGDRKVDIRAAVAPTVNGEMAVLRLLDKSTPARGLTELGMLPASLEQYLKLLRNPYGMIIITGPTGSGKTTTLYASLGAMDTRTQNVITVEDPAEYRFKSINQIQVNVQAGLTFASALRSILRLDPNVILIGEVRDKETASIAIQSALTGHLVMSSLHSNDAVGALFRLVDLGIEVFLIAAAVVGAVEQRMVRRLCPECKQLMEANATDKIAYEKELGEKLVNTYYGTGCYACNKTGFMGRVGLFGIVTVTDKIRAMMAEHASKADIKAEAIREGMVPMIRDGMLKVKAGITTPSEVVRATFTQD